MARTDLIIDFETMGSDSTKCAVIDMSAMVFDWDKFTSNDPYTLSDVFKVKKFKFDVAQQVRDYKWEIDQGTLQFWSEQDSEVRKNIAPKTSDLSVPDFIKQFNDFLIDSPKINYWWSRSNSFDPVILTRIFKVENKLPHMESHLQHWKVRDTRTFIDAKFDFQLKQNGFPPVANEEKWDSVFKAHDSAWDVLADVMRLQSITRAENDLEQITI